MLKGKEEKPHLKPALVIPAAVIALCLAGYMAYRSLAPMSMTTLPMTPQQQWMHEIGVKAKGDMSKLTPEEQQKLQEITGGQGQRALDQIAHPSGGYR
jgi:hypothetical protein